VSRLRLSTREIAFLALFAALSAVVSKFVPGFPILGGSGSIKFGSALAPVYGLFVGPYLGALAALIGGLVAADNLFGALTSFGTAISAFITGMLTQGKGNPRGSQLKGWMVVTAVFSLLISGWYITWVGQRAPLYPVLHFLGLLVVLIGREWIAHSFKGNNKGKLVISIGLASYCGIIANHMFGNLVFIEGIGFLIPVQVVEGWLKALKLPDVPSLFMYLIPISAIERSLMTAIATLVGASLVPILRSAGLFHRGPKPSFDIDPVIYGSERCRKVHAALKTLLGDEKSSVKAYDLEGLKRLFNFRSGDKKSDFMVPLP